MLPTNYISFILICLFCFCNGKEFPKLGYITNDNANIYQGINDGKTNLTNLGILYKHYPIVVDKEVEINGDIWYRIHDSIGLSEGYMRWVNKKDIKFENIRPKLFGIYFVYKKLPKEAFIYYDSGSPDYSIYIYSENELILHKVTSKVLDSNLNKNGRYIIENQFQYNYGIYHTIDNKISVRFIESNEVKTSEFQILSIPVRGEKKDIIDQLECEVRDNKLFTCYLNGAEQHIIKKIYLTLGL